MKRYIANFVGLMLSIGVLLAVAVRFAPAQVIQNGGGNFQAAIAGNTLASHNFANQINTAGTLIGAQPACGDLTGAAASCGTNATELVSGLTAVARGGTNTATPGPLHVDYLTSGTSYVPPAGTVATLFLICAGGGGGGGSTTGGATVCTAAGGGSGGCGLYWFNSSQTISYTLGGLGTAGTNGASPAAGGNGGNSTVVSGGTTQTWGGGVGGGIQNAACSSAPAGGTAGTSASANWGSTTGISRILAQAASAGVAGSATATAAAGGSNGNNGGNGGTVSAGGASVLAPMAGQAGYAIAMDIGAF